MILYVEQVLAISFGLLYSKNRKGPDMGCSEKGDDTMTKDEELQQVSAFPAGEKIRTAVF